jgi:type IV pilus assembly protein PilX
MRIRSSGGNRAQRGMVLVSSLLLLIVVTIIALSMFRSFGIQEKIAGNVREKQRALQAAVSAQTFAENWLENYPGTASSLCAGTLNANIGQVQICSNTLPSSVADVTVVPWAVGQTTYTPPNMLVQAASVNAASVDAATYYGTYTAPPAFYVSDMGASTDSAFPGEIYQIDAVGYGGNSNTVAEVESTYVVYTSSWQYQ